MNSTFAAANCLRTGRNRYRTRKLTVGTTKKSIETNCFAWLFRKVRQVWEGGFRSRAMYFGHCSLADFDTEFERFPMDPRCSPKRIRQTLLVDQFPNLETDGWSSWFAISAFPSPIAAESPALPSNNRFGLHDKQRRAPLRPEAGQPNPQQAVRGVWTKSAALRPLEDR